MTTALAQAHPNEVAKRISGRDYISFSAISLYQRCPLAYRFKYIDDLPEETVSASLVFGGGIHASVERHFNELMAGNPAPDHDTLLDVFWDSWRDRNEDATIKFSKNEGLNSIGQLADRVLKAFRESELAKPDGRILGVEEQLRGEIVPGVPDLFAKIDLLTETDDSIVVCDFKTSRSRWNVGQAESQSEQLLLYSELARQLVPEKAVRLEFAVISKTKQPIAERHDVPTDPLRVARTKQIVKRVWQAISSGEFYPAPSPINCGSCPFHNPCQSWSG